MIDHLTLRRLMFITLLAFVLVATIFVRVLPLEHGARLFPPPELGLMMAFAWTLRRPDYVPVFLVAFFLLIGDMFFLRPPGLWPALAIIGLEVLRARQSSLAEQPFLTEVLLVAATLMGMVLAEWLILSIFMVDHITFGQSLLRFLSTIAFYPVVVLISTWGFGVVRLRPGELETEAL